MKKPYRPEGFKNPYSILPEHMEREYPVLPEWSAYEAGADDYARGLSKNRIWPMTPEGMIEAANKAIQGSDYTSGYFTFIPEE